MLLKRWNKNTKQVIPILPSYTAKLCGCNFYFLPSTLKEFLEKHSKELKVFTSIFLRNEYYNIDMCKKLIKDVENENKKEQDINFFFQGLD